MHTFVTVHEDPIGTSYVIDRFDGDMRTTETFRFSGPANQHYAQSAPVFLSYGSPLARRMPVSTAGMVAAFQRTARNNAADHGSPSWRGGHTFEITDRAAEYRDDPLAAAFRVTR